MSSCRARANHSLYLGKIVLAGWRNALNEGNYPVLTTHQAYRAAVQRHLREAYGWFLLSVAGIEEAAAPPLCCDELPPVPQGKAVAGEVREFMQLEQSGWLQQMLADDMDAKPSVRSSGNLAVQHTVDGPEEAQNWADQLGAVFDRMSDSLDEC
tara:strand:+ start:215212 stop:215673 length:462 start_codon:yes stop_codon:yes gene_type:complete